MRHVTRSMRSNGSMTPRRHSTGKSRNRLWSAGCGRSSSAAGHSRSSCLFGCFPPPCCMISGTRNVAEIKPDPEKMWAAREGKRELGKKVFTEAVFSRPFLRRSRCLILKINFRSVTVCLSRRTLSCVVLFWTGSLLPYSPGRLATVTAQEVFPRRLRAFGASVALFWLYSVSESTGNCENFEVFGSFGRRQTFCNMNQDPGCNYGH